MAVAILRYVSDYGTLPAEREVTLNSGQYIFTSDDLPVLTYENYTFCGWLFDDEVISDGDVLHADDGEVIELTAYWAAEPAVASDENTVEERPYLGREGLKCYDGHIRAYVDHKTEIIAENVAYINAEDNENIEVDEVVDGSGNSAGVVIFTVMYTDEQAVLADAPVVYPEGADMDTLLAAGQARMLILTPPDSDTEMAKKLGVLDLCFVNLGAGTLQFAGTITGKDGNEAVMAEFFLETNEITITPAVQNSAGSGSSGGGGVVTITDNGNGTYSSSHTPAEIAAMAQTGAVVAVMENALGLLSAIPLYMCVDEVAIFKDFDIDEDIADTKKILVNSIVVMESSVTVNTSTIENMDGASASVGGNNGLVPAPYAGQQNAVLHGDGTWRTISIVIWLNPEFADTGEGDSKAYCDLAMTTQWNFSDIENALYHGSIAFRIYDNGIKDITHMIASWVADINQKTIFINNKPLSFADTVVEDTNTTT